MEALARANDPETNPARTWKGVYTIVERGGKKYWLRIGVAFTNQDSTRVLLDANPRNGELIIKTPAEWEQRRRNSAQENLELPLGGVQ